MKKLLALTIVAGSGIAIASTTTACTEEKVADGVYFTAINDPYGQAKADPSGYNRQIEWSKTGAKYTVDVNLAPTTTFAYAKNGAVVVLTTVKDNKVTNVQVDFVRNNLETPAKYTAEFTVETDGTLKAAADTGTESTKGTFYLSNGAKYETNTDDTNVKKWMSQAKAFAKNNIVGRKTNDIKNFGIKDTVITNESLGTSGTTTTNLNTTTAVLGTYTAVVASFTETNKKKA